MFLFIFVLSEEGQIYYKLLLRLIYRQHGDQVFSPTQLSKSRSLWHLVGNCLVCVKFPLKCKCFIWTLVINGLFANSAIFDVMGTSFCVNTNKAKMLIVQTTGLHGANCVIVIQVLQNVNKGKPDINMTMAVNQKIGAKLMLLYLPLHLNVMTPCKQNPHKQRWVIIGAAHVNTSHTPCRSWFSTQSCMVVQRWALSPHSSAPKSAVHVSVWG